MFACVLIAFWLLWCVALVALVRRGHAGRTALAGIVWALLMMVLMGLCAEGYVSDLIHYQTPHWSPESDQSAAAMRPPRVCRIAAEAFQGRRGLTS